MYPLGTSADRHGYKVFRVWNTKYINSLSDDLHPDPYTSPSLPTLLLDSDICPDGTQKNPDNVRKNTHSDGDRIQAAIDTWQKGGGAGPAKIFK